MKKTILFLFWGIALILNGLVATAQTAPQGKYLLFNGIDQHLLITNHADFNIVAGESYTICCRILAENFDGQYSIFSKGNNLVPNGFYELSTYRSTNGPNIGLSVINSENTNLGAPYFYTIPSQTWLHVAWVYNAGEKNSKIYVNGYLMNSVFNTSIGRLAIQNNADLIVGCVLTDAAEPGLTNFWPGRMDELRIWGKALTREDVIADQTASKPDPIGLLAAYDFENIVNDAVPDISGNGHFAQIFGYGIKVMNTILPVGMGETNERLMAFRMEADPITDAITNMTVDLNGTDAISDISSLKIYYNHSKERLDLKTATLYSSTVPSAKKNVLTGNLKPALGDNYFWVTADISPDAREGHKVRAAVLTYSMGDRNLITVPTIEGSRTILLTSKLLFSGGDGGAEHYRIPAMVTAKDGSLITATDKRWNTVHDLPNHIDVVVRRSADRGQTWSNTLTIAGLDSDLGFGDPALVLNQKNGEIVCLMAADKGFYYSTATAPILIYQTISSDNGITWSAPVNITPQIYGPGSTNPVTQNWQGAFVTSGAATQLRSGRLIAVMSVREDVSRNVSNFIIYSDDNAKTWKVAPNRAGVNGSEAKLVDLDNRKVLMSIRNSGNRMFNISKDRGMTWGIPFPQVNILDPACNGDMIRYTSIYSGYKKNRLLHSIPYASTRKNVSVLMSYDEGQTWPVRKSIYAGPSAYSALSVMNDGSIGMYYEVGEYETYQMYFTRFTLDWLTDGADTWSGHSKDEINSTDIIADNPAGFTVYPNPAIGEVNVAGKFNFDSLIDIYDTKGVMMRRTRVENPDGPVRISLEGLSSGIYFVKIGEAVEKLVVK